LGFAAGLASRGVRKGDRVAVMLANRLEAGIADGTSTVELPSRART
jgi:hypothetical protein